VVIRFVIAPMLALLARRLGLDPGRYDSIYTPQRVNRIPGYGPSCQHTLMIPHGLIRFVDLGLRRVLKLRNRSVPRCLTGRQVCFALMGLRRSRFLNRGKLRRLGLALPDSV
jgi:hypothetical protein